MKADIQDEKDYNLLYLNTVASGKTIIRLGCFEKGQIKLIKKNEDF